MNDELEVIYSKLIKYREILKDLNELAVCSKENQAQHADDLNELRKDLEDQIAKLEKKTYEIAVVGTEKAGKTSMLNAWIGFDLLPTEEKRCTYTTTVIQSVSDMDEQKYTIEYFTIDEYKQTNFEKNLPESELKDLDRHIEAARKYLNRELEQITCRDFKNEKDKLRSAICDPSHALAIKKICIYVKIENIDKNIIFYDVPGHDSSITLHKQQTEDKIAAADSVLYVRRFIKPTLVESESEILKICDSTNPYIRAKDKLVVALTGCDQAASAKQYNKLLGDNQKIWKDLNLKPWRLVPVCSLAELPSQSEETKRVKDLLQKNNGGKTGFQELKAAVAKCVSEARIELAKDRFASIPNRVNDISVKILSCTRKEYNIDENTEIKLDDKEMDKISKEWWRNYWRMVEEDFQEYYQREIRPKKNPDESNFISAEDFDFKELYDKTVESTFQGVEATKKERQEKIYKSCNLDDGIMNPDYGNIKIRLELAQEFINSLDKITDELTKFVWIKVNKMIEWMRKKLWHIPEIKEEMIGKLSDSNMENIYFKKPFEALIQRLARPAINIFITHPRTETARKRVMKEYIMELMTLSKFIEKGEIWERGIIQFLANGKLGDFEINFKKSGIAQNTEADKEEDEEEEEPLEEQNEDNISRSDSLITVKLKQPVTSQPMLSIDPQFDKLQFNKSPTNIEEVQQEIQQDLQEFLECMKNSVFYSSGIQRFQSSELDTFKRKFIELENDKGRWSHYFETYLKKDDPIIKIPAPRLADELKERERIVNNIKHIREINEQLGMRGGTEEEVESETDTTRITQIETA